MSSVKAKNLPVPICQSAVDGLTAVEKLFIPLLEKQGKIRIVSDSQEGTSG